MGYTAEYLSAFREKAKELLPAWMVERIHKEAKPVSGGRARHRTPATIDNTGASISGVAKADLEALLNELAAILSGPEYPPYMTAPVSISPDDGGDDGDAAGDPVDPDDAATDLPEDDQLAGEDRLQPSEAADIVLRSLWRSYMATHHPPTADQAGPEPNMVEFTDELTKKVKFWKADGDPQQIVYGVVLIPEAVDSQGDIVGADEIEEAAHKFLTQYRESGIQHVGDALPSLEVIESYIAPCDMEVAGNQVPKGAWVMAVKINDPEIWQMVLDGKLTGFSIQGYANSEEAA